MAFAVAAIVISFATGLVAHRFVRSPAQAAADAAPPPLSVITAPVRHQRGVISVRFDGSLQHAESTAIRPPEATAGSGRQVVTKVSAREGGRVTAGQSLAEVNGQPILILPGVIPSYRSLTLRDAGPDVRQLQAGLTAVGISTHGDPTGVFDAGTASAVSILFDRAGYQVPRTGLEQVASARQAVEVARRSVRAAHSDQQRHAAEAAISSAQAALAAAEAAASIYLPQGAIAFVPHLPADVVSLPISPGADAPSVVATLESGAVRIVGEAQDGGSKDRVHVGDAAWVTTTTGTRRHGAVASVTKVRPAADDPGGVAKTVVTVELDHPFRRGRIGDQVRVEVQVATSGNSGLSVPVGAVTQTADGLTSVSVVEAGGSARTVKIIAGFVGDGYVQVRPVDGGLHEGDQVEVGLGNTGGDNAGTGGS
ncbi:peptidoglycan-binding domain-containing protein [Nocardioides sp.]|uniref:peptidoglycan-binding protein n=1 Tax=Nocardioides sp. TaxID=35761 RepID=UPI002608B566|nr:peptidoglycan-binding domain-containing protein [Nocardioides sp.]